MNGTDDIPNISLSDGLKAFMLGFLLYAAITLYEADFWLIIYENGVIRDCMSEIVAMVQCLFVSKITTSTFEITAFGCVAYRYLKATPKWYEHLTAALVALAAMLGRTYAYQGFIYNDRTDIVVYAIIAAILAGLYFMVLYLILAAKEVYRYLSGDSDAANTESSLETESSAKPEGTPKNESAAKPESGPEIENAATPESGPGTESPAKSEKAPETENVTTPESRLGTEGPAKSEDVPEAESSAKPESSPGATDSSKQQKSANSGSSPAPKG